MNTIIIICISVVFILICKVIINQYYIANNQSTIKKQLDEIQKEISKNRSV